MQLSATNVVVEAAKTAPRIGVLEADPQVRATLVRYLSAQRFPVVTLKNGADARSAVQHGTIDVLLFDFASTHEDGLSILVSVRAMSRIPVLIVSGRSEPVLVAAALDAGADDYVTKPVALEEFGARLRSIIRRAPQTSAGSSRHVTTLQIHGAKFDLQNRDIVGASGRVQLTEREALILSLLHEAHGLPVSRSMLTRVTLGQSWDFSMRTLDVHVSNLRSKLASIGMPRSVILTARNMGYQLSPTAFMHAEPQDQPPARVAGTHTIHSGGIHASKDSWRLSFRACVNQHRGSPNKMPLTDPVAVSREPLNVAE